MADHLRDFQPMRYPAPDLDAAGLLKALAHPARLAIVEAIGAAGGCCCGDIVRRLPLAQSTVSQHLKILKESGLIQGVIEGPRANYSIDRARALAAAAMLRELAGQIEAGAGSCCPAPETTKPADLDIRETV